MIFKKIKLFSLLCFSFCMMYGSENFHESRDQIYIVEDQFEIASELAQESLTKYRMLTNRNWDDRLKVIRDITGSTIAAWDLYLRLRTDSWVVKNPGARKEVQSFFDNFEVYSGNCIVLIDRVIARKTTSLNCDQIKELKKHKALMQGLKNLYIKIK